MFEGAASSFASSDAGKVNVAIRVRPLIEREKAAEEKPCWIVGENNLRCLTDELQTEYVYDHVFGQSDKTEKVYSKVVAPIVEKAFDGFNGTILCYGQTSSGKTHTLYGSNDDKGIILLFADHLFNRIESDKGKRSYIIKVALLEIYNDKVTDMLNSECPVELVERDGGFVPKKLEELTVTDSFGIRDAAERIQLQRKVGETNMNKDSSRSHTILRITIIATSCKEDSENDFDGFQSALPRATTAVLHFVDLAGSEKQSQTGAEGDRLKEAIKINSSLSALSRVISQLSQQAEKERNQKKKEETKHTQAGVLCTTGKAGPQSRFINYRDNNLTRILKSTLNGEAFTAMICNVTPASFDETKSTLTFAKQAKDVSVRPKQNLFLKSEDKKEFEAYIAKKEEEVNAMRRQLQVMKELTTNETNFKFPPSKFLETDRRHSLCPTIFTRTEKFEPPLLNHFPPRSSMSADTFKTVEQNIQDIQTREAVKKETKIHKLEVDLRNQEVQTDPILQSPQKLSLQKGQSGTPVQTLKISNALLRESIESDHNDWRDEKSFFEKEMAMLRDELVEKKRKEDENSYLKMEIESLKEELTITKKMKQDDKLFFGAEIAKLREELEKRSGSRHDDSSVYQKEIQDLREELIITKNSTKDEKSSLEMEIAKLKEELGEKKEKYSICQSEIHDLREELNTAEKSLVEKTRLEMEITKLKEELGEKKDTYSNSQSEIKSLQEELNGVKILLVKLKDELGEKKEKYSICQNEIKDLHEQLSAAEKSLVEKSRLETEIAKLKEELGEKKEKYSISQNEIKDFREKLSAAEKSLMEKSRLETEIAKLKEEIGEKKLMEEKYYISQNEIKDLYEQLSAAEKSLVEKSRLETEIAKLKEELGEKKETYSNSQSEIKSLQEELNGAKNLLVKLKDELGEKKEMYSTSQNEIKHLREQLNAAEKSLEEKLSLEMEITKLKEELGEKKVIEEKYSISLYEIDDLREQLRAAEKSLVDKSRLETEITKLKEELGEKKEKYSISQNEIKDLREQLSAAEKSLEEKSSLEMEIAKLKEELIDKKEKYSISQNEIDNLREQLSAAEKSLVEKLRMETEITKLREELGEKKETYSNSQSEIKSLQEELNGAKNLLVKLKDELGEKKEKYSICQNEIKDLHEQLSAAEKSLVEKSRLETEIAKLKEELGEKKEKYSISQNEIKEFREKLSAAEKSLMEKSRLETEIAKLKEEIGEKKLMEEKYYISQNEIKDLYEQLSAAEKSLVEKSRLETEIEKLKEELEEKKETCSNSQSEIKSLQEELLSAAKKSQTEMDALREELETTKRMKNRVNGDILQVNRSAQCDFTTESIEFFRRRGDTYKNNMLFEQREKEKAKRTFDKIVDAKDKEIAELKDWTRQQSERIDQLKGEIHVLVGKQSKDGEVQCNLLEELIHRSSKGEKGLLPNYIPDVASLRCELQLAKSRVDFLQIKVNRCTCTPKTGFAPRVGPSIAPQGGGPIKGIYNKPAGFGPVPGPFSSGLRKPPIPDRFFKPSQVDNHPKSILKSPEPRPGTIDVDLKVPLEKDDDKKTSRVRFHEDANDMDNEDAQNIPVETKTDDVDSGCSDEEYLEGITDPWIRKMMKRARESKKKREKEEENMNLRLE